MKALLRKIDRAVIVIGETIAAAGLALLLVLLVAKIVSRFFRIQALAPPDEIITLLFAWLVFIGSAVLFRHGDHLRVEMIDLFLEKRPRLKSWHSAVLGTVQLLFVLVFLRSSIRLFAGSGTRVSPMLGLPQRYWYVAILISAILMLIYTVLLIVRALLAGRARASINDVSESPE